LEDPERAPDHVDGDVVDGDAVDVAFERTVMRMTVQDDVGPVGTDGAREALGAKDEPEPLRLAEQRLLRRRVMKEGDPDRARLDARQRLVEAVDVSRRLR